MPEIPHNSDNGGKKWLRLSSNRCRATLRQSGRDAFKWSMSPVSVSGNKETFLSSDIETMVLKYEK